MTAIVTEICDSLCSLAHASPEDGYECVIMQGSGTFAVESVLSTVVPRRIDKGRLLVLSNGAYGDRLGQIAARIDAEHTVLRWGEREAVDAEAAWWEWYWATKKEREAEAARKLEEERVAELKRLRERYLK